MLRLLLPLALLGGSSFTGVWAPCPQIRIVPFVGKNHKPDRFNLSVLVAKQFRQLGFEVLASDVPAATECPALRCEITHTEHYWQAQSDTVRLRIYDGSGQLVREVMGWSGPYEMTFKSGFSNATTAALAQLQASDFR